MCDRLQRFTARFTRGQFRIFRELRNLGQKIGRNFSLDSVIEHFRLIWIFCAPLAVAFFPAIVIGKQLLFVFGEIIAYFLRDKIMFIGQTETLAPGIDEFCAGFTVRFVGAGYFRNAFADECVGDDELRLPVVSLLCDV